MAGYIHYKTNIIPPNSYSFGSAQIHTSIVKIQNIVRTIMSQRRFLKLKLSAVVAQSIIRR